MGSRAGGVRAGYLGPLATRSGLTNLPMHLPSGPADPIAEDTWGQRLELSRVIIDLVGPLVDGVAGVG